VSLTVCIDASGVAGVLQMRCQADVGDEPVTPGCTVRHLASLRSVSCSSSPAVPRRLRLIWRAWRNDARSATPSLSTDCFPRLVLSAKRYPPRKIRVDVLYIRLLLAAAAAIARTNGRCCDVVSALPRVTLVECISW